MKIACPKERKDRSSRAENILRKARERKKIPRRAEGQEEADPEYQARRKQTDRGNRQNMERYYKRVTIAENEVRRPIRLRLKS